MAKLEIQIGADNSDLERKVAEAQVLVKNLQKDMNQQFKLGNIDIAEKMQQEVNLARQSLKGLQNDFKQTGGSVTAMGGKVANGSNALMQFSRIAQDAPFGIMGIGNNITATAESFGYLKQSTGSAGGALKAMAASLMGTGGILLAVSLVTTGLTIMSQQGLTLSDVIGMITGKARDLAKVDLNKAFESDKVVEATQNVQVLTNEIQLAKDGFIDKDGVVKHYNDTIGKTTGLVTNLDEAEKGLIKNGSAYIQMTLLKAAANLASEDAAKSALEAEKSRQKKLKEFSSVKDELRFGGLASGTGVNADGVQSVEDYKRFQDNKTNAQKKRKAEEIKINEDAKNANLSIARKFNEEAAKISKDFKFNFFGDNKSNKKTGSKKQDEIFNTPQVSGLESFLNPKSLAIINDAVIEVSPKIKIAESSKTDFDMQMQDMWTSFADFANSGALAAISESLSGIGEALGQSLITGGNFFASAGSVLLGSLGQYISDMGAQLIKMGLLAVTQGTLLKIMATNPIAGIPAGLAAIGVGIALSAVGGAMKSKSQQMGTTGSSSGGSTSTGSGGNSYQPSGASSGGYSTGGGYGSVVFEISGQSLIGVLGNAMDKNRRLGGN